MDTNKKCDNRKIIFYGHTIINYINPYSNQRLTYILHLEDKLIEQIQKIV